ncbi:MAG: hypothetical protein D6708_09785 [Candidatus Dadabacteria bacterium]|nr:MAG: hypothetical protein D6708_09785 [Candidatus Dadabacteria bacterium]
MRDWRHLTGKPVVVVAAGVEHRGVAVEMGERGILLRTPSGFREIPWDRITALRPDPAAGRPGGLGR